VQPGCAAVVGTGGWRSATEQLLAGMQFMMHYIHSSSYFTDFYNPLAGFSLLILEVSRSHTMTQHSQ
jgi:hypothetical protein